MKKVCKVCRMGKDAIAFRKSNDCKDGLATICRDCKNQSERQKYAQKQKDNATRTDFPAEKQCSTCNEIKSTAEHFYVDLTKPDGYKARCKSCRRKICNERDKRKVRYAARVEAEKVLVGHDSKRCSRCDVIKLKNEFYANKRMKDGLCSYCKACKSQMDKDQIIKFEKHRLENVMPNNKCCNKCKVAKPIDEFYENRHSLDGLQSICISCSKSKLNTNTNNRARATWMANYAPILEEDIKALLEASDYRCTYCGIEVYKGKNLEYDHKIPICRGGPHTIENLAVACSKDNRRKGRMTDTEYKEQLKQKEQMLIKTGDAQPITIIKTDLPDDQITKKALDKALEKVKSEQLETDRSKLKPE